ncbi:MAG: fibrobacter succinogenes major paralogous domain-containing protein [Bacteroidia bacterium]|nr:fibrobacter succinogenes major paralogous domain-containing protein [Bacteroidia bacterium]
MKLEKLLLSAAALLVIAAAVSCHKNKTDEDDSTESFTGSVSFTLPSYISPGEVHTFHIDSVSREDGGTYGCIWTIEALDIKDTTRVEADPSSVSGDYIFTVPDTLCAITVKGTVFAEGYTTISTSLSSTIVSADKEKGSITGRSFDTEKDFVFTDSRDGKQYWCTTIGDRDWFRENLACEGTGYPYDGSSNLSQILGHYYSWNEALVSCPEGWRLPDTEDWSALAAAVTGKDFGATDSFSDIAGKMMANVYFNGNRMWEYWPKVNITDSSRFSAIPTGYGFGDAEDGYSFAGYCEYAAFWVNGTYGDKALYRYLYVDKTDCFAGTADKDGFLASVRCVRDSTR